MSERFRSYAVARTIFSISEFIGWCVVVLGLLIGILLATTAGQYVGGLQKFLLFLTGCAGSIVGLHMVGSAQFWRAGVDGAEYAQQGLRLEREQLEISKQSLKLQYQERQSFASLNTDTDHSASTAFSTFASAPAESQDNQASQATAYRGEEIRLYGSSYRAIGRAFETLQAAQAAIDQKLKTSGFEGVSQTPELQSSSQPGDAPSSFGELRATKYGAGENPGQSPKQIREENGKFVYGKMSFSSREAAEKYVSQLGVNPNFIG